MVEEICGAIYSADNYPWISACVLNIQSELGTKASRNEAESDSFLVSFSVSRNLYQPPNVNCFMNYIFAPENYVKAGRKGGGGRVS